MLQYIGVNKSIHNKHEEQNEDCEYWVVQNIQRALRFSMATLRPSLGSIFMDMHALTT